MAELFDRDVKTIGKHVNNALHEELADSGSRTVASFATVQTEGEREAIRVVEHYSLDMVQSVGYRVKPQRGVEFRRWATDALRRYVIGAMRRTRIAATMFLCFLDRNGALFDGNRKLIDDSTLVAITIMIAESKPVEKDAMVALVMNFLAPGQ
jgi:hypothetical protein